MSEDFVQFIASTLACLENNLLVLDWGLALLHLLYSELLNWMRYYQYFLLS